MHIAGQTSYTLFGYFTSTLIRINLHFFYIIIYTFYFRSELFPLSVFQTLNITGAIGVPNVDITDPALLSTCKVPNPGICQSQLTITGASLSTAASMAVAVAGMLATVALQ